MGCIISPSLYIFVCVCVCITDGDELDSDEESGKDWSDLEEEARKGKSTRLPIPTLPSDQIIQAISKSLFNTGLGSGLSLWVSFFSVPSCDYSN